MLVEDRFTHADTANDAVVANTGPLVLTTPLVPLKFAAPPETVTPLGTFAVFPLPEASVTVEVMKFPAAS